MTTIALNPEPQAGAQPSDASLFKRARSDSPSSDFASVLGKVKQGTDETPAEFSRRTAENFVAIALIQPLLKQLRDSNQAAPPFAPTSGEKEFQGLADAQLAQRMVHRSRFPLVDKIADKLMQRTRGAAGRTDAPDTRPSSDPAQTQVSPAPPIASTLSE